MTQPAPLAPPATPLDLTPAERWRLVLGEAAGQALGQEGEQRGVVGTMDQALAWLYGRQQSGDKREQLERSGGDGASALSTPEWINAIHSLFPRETIERLERDAIEQYQVYDLVTNPEVLENVRPNPALLQAVLHTKHLMNPEVLLLARKLVEKVVAEIMQRLAKSYEHAFGGRRARHQLLPRGSARQLALRETVRRNLRHYDMQRRQLALQQPWFYAHQKQRLERWQIILVVDQSGSMVSSVIHAAVTAACLWRLPGVKTHLIAFDTEVVDLSEHTDDPVQTLMQVQLGGGTDIARAVNYAANLVEVPRRAIIVVISDFYEGGDPQRLIRLVHDLCAQGSRVLGLAALDDQAVPAYDRDIAARLVAGGAEIGAMTPGQLANWLAEKLG